MAFIFSVLFATAVLPTGRPRWRASVTMIATILAAWLVIAMGYGIWLLSLYALVVIGRLVRLAERPASPAPLRAESRLPF